MRIQVTGATGEQLTRRMLKLAWDAGHVVGMGMLHDRGPGMTEDQVWTNAAKAPGRLLADYVFGRMIKLNVAYDGNAVSSRDDAYHEDYQSFCRKYPNFKALAEAAAASFKVTVSVDRPATAAV